ncbi:TRAP transporter substrate-binding protein [uncultured Cohaesibacter sp.]|uniref:TRAP transporter substrate-binding protein n=1 Tax=uncultured Cohaesibacter sp. TaxID=1002546 RepID=UPI00292D454D|nr:TRAP transporter substrate-binding protein [uncultured Cohaesibacter sp.]
MNKLMMGIAAVAMMVTAGNVNAATRMKLAHNLAEDHPTSQALQHFVDEVEQKTNGDVKIKLFLNGVLGSEREVLEQLQNGAVDMTRVGASSLENFDSIFQAFTLPYLFDSEDTFYKVMEGPIADKIYAASKDSGFVGLTFFDGGARSFYTKDRPINKPEDLKGEKIRVMNSHTSIRMVELMGGTPTPLAYGEIYTALQQGVIDGAENNPTALTLGRHGEVVKYYSFDEHGRIPDFLVISNKAMDKLTPEQQAIVKEAARNATKFHRGLWEAAVKTAIDEAQNKLHVQISYPEKAPFREAVKPLYDEYRKDPAINELVTEILAVK